MWRSTAIRSCHSSKSCCLTCSLSRARSPHRVSCWRWRCNSAPALGLTLPNFCLNLASASAFFLAISAACQRVKISYVILCAGVLTMYMRMHLCVYTHVGVCVCVCVCVRSKKLPYADKHTISVVSTLLRIHVICAHHAPTYTHRTVRFSRHHHG